MMFIFIKPLLILSFSISVGKLLKVNGNNQRGEKKKNNKISAPFMIYHWKMDWLSFYSLSSAWQQYDLL